MTSQILHVKMKSGIEHIPKINNEESTSHKKQESHHEKANQHHVVSSHAYRRILRYGILQQRIL